jgi:hypothetical protein
MGLDKRNLGRGTWQGPQGVMFLRLKSLCWRSKDKRPQARNKDTSMGFNRRSLLKGIATFPAFATLQKLGFAGNPASFTTSLDSARRQSAIQLLRFMNTAQYRYRGTHDRFVGLADLLKADTTDQFIRDPIAEKRGIGRSFFESLNFEAEEVLPGLGFRLKEHAEGTGYLALISSGDDQNPLVFSTDEKGIIYEGTALENLSDVSSRAAKSAILTPVALGARTRVSPLVRALGSFAFMGDVTPNFLCDGCCDCSCQQTWVQTCFNCGCQHCIWCCCPY